jgi:hypothetical protein
MAFGKLNSIDIPSPSNFSIEDKVNGGFNTTMMGNRRRYISSVKKVWRLKYNNLLIDDYNNIYNEMMKEVASGLQLTNVDAIFTINEERFSVSGEHVHIDITNRDFVNSNFDESAEVVLTQV